MRTGASWISATVLASISLSIAHGGFDLKHEHAGDVFYQAHAPTCCVNGVMHNGNSTGVFKKINGENLYLSYPPGPRKKTNPAILYLTDIFGVQLINNRLLADSLAKAGYLVVVPDLFRGDPVPATALSDPNSTFNLTAWRSRHPETETTTVIDATLSALQTTFHTTRIGSVGYCFGGRFVARYLTASSPISAGFTAHPSNTNSSEWAAVAKPVSIAFGDLDASNTPENRTAIEAIFEAGNRTFQTVLYANAEHGFAVRTDLGVREKAFAQEGAYFQAVRWLDTWVNGEEEEDGGFC